MRDLKAEAKRQIKDRIDFYENGVKVAKTEGKYSEADVETKFIDPFLKALGWDPSSNEVKKRYPIGRKIVDYALQIGDVGREPNILVEVKSLVQDLDGKEWDEDIQDYITYPEKVVGYAWRSRVNWAILTNFKELRVYNVGWSKIPEKALWFSAMYDKFLDEKTFERIWAISREGVATRILDTYDTRTKRKPVDRQFLEDLVKCRLLLVDNIRRRNKGLKPEFLKECTQRILDRLVIMRAAEDLRVEKADLLRREIVKEKGGWDKLRQWLFRNFDTRFNSRIFAKHPCDDLEIDDEVIQTVVDILYNGTGESSGYRFDEIHADILGSMYEDYIGYILKEEGEILKLEKEMGERKAKGIYYTPTYVVEYIVENTLGTLLKDMSPSEVKNICILDPACGSGSFLIKAQDVLKKYYESTMEQLKKKEGEKIDLYLSKDYASLSKDILTKNIYGVDLDPQAAEIASVNLSLKVLADMKKEMKLPEVMGKNIKIGNSLLSGKEPSLKSLPPHEQSKLKLFDWDEKFPEIFEQGGFDVVIGNPPYFKVRKDNPIQASEDFKEIRSGMMNAAAVFINKSMKLVKNRGFVGMIVPKLLAYTQSWNKVRKKIFTQSKLCAAIDCGKAFKEVLLEQVIVIFQKTDEDLDYLDQNVYEIGEIKDGIVKITAKVSQGLSRREDTIFLEPNPIAYAIRNKLRKSKVTLGDITDIILGAGIQSFKCFRKRPEKDDMRILRGNDVQRYRIRGCLYFSKNAPEMKPYLNVIKKLMKPHIVAQRIIAHVLYPEPHLIIMAAYEENGAFAFNTVTNFIVTDPNYDYRYILALLNSKLYSFYASKFLYSNAIRSMDFYEGYAKRLPVYPLTMKQQKPLIALVDKITELKREYSGLIVDFDRYLTKPIVTKAPFNDFYEKLSVDNKEALDKSSKGTIKKLKVGEQNNWLVFKVDYIVKKKGEKHEFKDVEVVKCKFKDEPLRKFLFYTINNYKKPLGTGNLLLKILRIPIPCFDKDPKKNELIIAKIMKEYLKAVREKERLEKEIQETDKMIDQIVYKLYGLNEEEIKIVEESLTQTYRKFQPNKIPS